MTTASGGRWSWRRELAAPFVVERLRPVELPILTETKRRIFGGDVAGALRYAYPLVLEDLQKAYGVQFPIAWTHEEILRRGLPPGAGPIGEFLPRLYRLYGPARYGEAVDIPESAGVETIELLRSIYAFAPMWRLYAWQRRSGLRRLFPPRATTPPPDAGFAEESAPEEPAEATAAPEKP
jgi:hypothetical protein